MSKVFKKKEIKIDDNIVKLELTEKVENQLKTFKLLIKNDVKNFNKAFAKLELDYLKLD